MFFVFDKSLSRGVIMSKLLAAITLLGGIYVSFSAFAAQDCVKYCQQACGGKGNVCLNNCNTKCEQRNSEKAGSSKR